jgi:hypothetical protein
MTAFCIQFSLPFVHRYRLPLLLESRRFGDYITSYHVNDDDSFLYEFYFLVLFSLSIKQASIRDIDRDEHGYGYGYGIARYIKFCEGGGRWGGREGGAEMDNLESSIVY